MISFTTDNIQMKNHKSLSVGESKVGEIDAEKIRVMPKVIGSIAVIKPLIEAMGIRRIIDSICPGDP